MPDNDSEIQKLPPHERFEGELRKLRDRVEPFARNKQGELDPSIVVSGADKRDIKARTRWRAAVDAYLELWEDTVDNFDPEVHRRLNQYKVDEERLKARRVDITTRTGDIDNFHYSTEDINRADSIISLVLGDISTVEYDKLSDVSQEVAA